MVSMPKGWGDWIGFAVIFICCAGMGFFAARLYYSETSCAECCKEGELCENEEEWSKTLMDCSGYKADADLMSNMLKDCEKEYREYKDKMLSMDELPAMTQCSLNLAECRGALKECQRR